MIDLTLEDSSTRKSGHSNAAPPVARLRQTDIRDLIKLTKQPHKNTRTDSRKRKRTDNSSASEILHHDSTQNYRAFTSHASVSKSREDFNKRTKPWPEKTSLDTHSGISSDQINSTDTSVGQPTAASKAPVLVSDDDEPSEANEVASPTSSSDPEHVSLDDYMEDSQLNKYLKNLHIETIATERRASEQRHEISFYKVGKTSCAPGKSVELIGRAFLRISKVLQNGKGEVFVSGRRLERENFQGAVMPVRRRNELVWIQHSKQSDNGDPMAFTVPVDQVIKNREIVFTNQTFPTVSSSTDHNSFQDPNQDVTHGALFCRWKRTRVLNGKAHIVEQMIELLRSNEADDKPRKNKQGNIVATRITAQQQRFRWRQARTTLGGSHETDHESLDIHGQWHNFKQQQYTFGDSFCGAGGMSRGALDANLRLVWAFDNDTQAMDTYTANFIRHGAKCMQISVDEFITWARGRQALVDVLHISPPCQPFSPAHTTPCDRDERNQACLFASHQLLEFTKPRVATIEQTWGLESYERNRDFFNALVCTFVSLGYSIRWSTLDCGQYGVPQIRKRLFIIAAGPGEKLPPFAAPTHGNGPGLRPVTTIEDAIKHIPQNAKNHDTNVPFSDGRPKPPFNARTQAMTVTCHGGMNNWHPSGLRLYTMRELACLQTFPLYHTFSGARGRTAAKKQNGNAVPPIFARAILRAVVKSLKESDEAEARELQ